MRFLKVLAIGLLIVAIGILAKPTYMVAKAQLAQVLLNNAWQRSQTEGGQHKPWSWADTYPVAKLTINNESFIVLSGMTGRTMAFGPGWLQSSAAPNKPGNTIVSAHNDTHFSILEGLRVGDFLTLEDHEKVEMKYRVTAIDIVHSSSENWLETSAWRQLTMITCYPFEVASGPRTQRLMVSAVAYSQG